MRFLDLQVVDGYDQYKEKVNDARHYIHKILVNQ